MGDPPTVPPHCSLLFSVLGFLECSYARDQLLISQVIYGLVRYALLDHLRGSAITTVKKGVGRGNSRRGGRIVVEHDVAKCFDSLLRVFTGEALDFSAV